MTDFNYFCGYTLGSIYCGTCDIRSACLNVTDEGPEDPILSEYIECTEDCRCCRRGKK